MAATRDTSYADADKITALGDFLAQLTETSRATGWHTPSMIVEAGEGEEGVVVGVRWLPTSDAYVVEIR